MKSSNNTLVSLCHVDSQKQKWPKIFVIMPLLYCPQPVTKHFDYIAFEILIISYLSAEKIEPNERT